MSSKPLKLSIIIPLFNEEATIQTVITSLLYLSFSHVELEIIVVDDGSTDSSLAKIKNIPTKKIHILHHKKNKGKGAAVRTGIEKATGEYILIQDADLEYSPLQIKKLVEPILQGKAKVVYGTRLKRLPNFTNDERTLRFFIHYLGNRFLSFLISILYGQWVTDMETGYKFFPSEAVKGMRLRSQGFEFEAELTAKLIKKGYDIVEVPIVTQPRGYHEGKKLQTLPDGYKAFCSIIKYRFVD